MRHDGRVYLEWAYVWHCEICGKKHFAESVVVEPSSEELDEIREHNEWNSETDEDTIGAIDTAVQYRMPYTVKCRACKVVFAVGNHCDEG